MLAWLLTGTAVVIHNNNKTMVHTNDGGKTQGIKGKIQSTGNMLMLMLINKPQWRRLICLRHPSMQECKCCHLVRVPATKAVKPVCNNTNKRGMHTAMVTESPIVACLHHGQVRSHPVKERRTKWALKELRIEERGERGLH